MSSVGCIHVQCILATVYNPPASITAYLGHGGRLSGPELEGELGVAEATFGGTSLQFTTEPVWMASVAPRDLWSFLVLIVTFFAQPKALREPGACATELLKTGGVASGSLLA